MMINKNSIAPILDTGNINANYPLSLRRFASGQYGSQFAYYLAQQKNPPECITIMNEDGYYYPYFVKSIPLKKGLFGYILLPKDKNLADVKIIWRGTEPTEPNSVQINLEEGGPAVVSFYQERNKIFQCFFQEIQKHYPDNPPLKLDIYGHSQGGALSQLFTTHFLIERYYRHEFDHIQTLNMTVLSSPGIPASLARLANEYAIKQHEVAKPLNIVANFGIVKGDLVPTLGLDSIFATLSSKYAIVNLLKISNEYCDYWKKGVYLGDGLQLHEILSILKNGVAGFLNAHSYNNYYAPVDENGKITVNCPYELLTNQNPDAQEKIRQALLNKCYKLQTSFYFMQKLLFDLDIFGLTDLLTLETLANVNDAYKKVLHFFTKSAPKTSIEVNEHNILQSHQIENQAVTKPPGLS